MQFKSLVATAAVVGIASANSMYQDLLDSAGLAKWIPLDSAGFQLTT